MVGVMILGDGYVVLIFDVLGIVMFCKLYVFNDNEMFDDVYVELGGEGEK